MQDKLIDDSGKAPKQFNDLIQLMPPPDVYTPENVIKSNNLQNLLP